MQTITDFHWIDLILILGYLIALIFISFWRKKSDSGEENYLLSGRKLTLPAFVATLVSTWYGGILGVGEFTWLYGISQWFAMVLPYYIFALLFAFYLAKKIRENPAISIPEAIQNSYGKKAGIVSSILIFLLINPAPYILMVALLAQIVIGASGFLIITIFVALFSAIYVGFGGFSAVVRTDAFQVLFMYAGFIMLFGFAWYTWGNPIQMWSELPVASKDPTGGQPLSWLFVWFFIAMWTFVDPSFHQRSAAAKNPETAKKGIIVSVGLWFVFDSLTLITALYGIVQIPDLERAAMIYPEMASRLLPVGLKGLFFLTILATIMSTLDSYLFLSGQTLGRDLLRHRLPHTNVITLTKWGVFISAILGVILVWIVPSVIELWFVIGSILIPGLLIPVLGIYFTKFRVNNRFIVAILSVPVLVSFSWFIFAVIFPTIKSGPFLGIEPFYPGLFASIFLFFLSKIRNYTLV